MEKRLHILNLEDNRLDYELNRETLEREGIACEIFWVETRKAFIDAILKGVFDIILADYSLPSFDGFKALELARQHCPEVPFIFVTGTLGEELAIEALKSGATDYVLKDRLFRLAPAVIRALKEREEKEEHRRAVQALEESENALKSIFRTVPAGIGVTINRVFKQANDRLCEMIGYAREEIIGQSAGLLYRSTEDFEFVGQEMDSQLGKVGTGTVETRWRRRDGRIIDVLLSSTPIDFKDRTQGVTFSALDITERIRAEKALRESEKRFQDLFEQAPLGYQSLDGEGFFMEVNQAWLDTLGYNRSEVIGRWFGDFLAPEFIQTFRERFPLFKDAGKIHSEFQMLHKNGERRFIAFEGRIGYTSQGRFKQTHCILQDITEQKRMAEDLKQSEERFRSLVETQTDLVCRFKPDGTFVFVNDAYCHFFGKTKDELVRMQWQPLPVDADRSSIEEKLRTLAPSNPTVLIENRLISGMGKVHWIQFVNRGFFDPQGNLVEIQSVGRDITERKEAEEEIRRLNDELEQRVRERTAQLEVANKELEGFSYSISHDLRAPLRHLTGFVNLLNQQLPEGLDEKSRHYLDVISDSAVKMGRLIDDILAFFRMGRKEMILNRLNLKSLVDEVLQMLQPEIQERKLIWSVGPLPEVLGDISMVQIVLTNLISNAVKFTRGKPKGKIEIGTRSDRTDEAVIFVRDNGAGFDMNFGDKLFKLFQRLHAESAFEGTGLGLAITQRIIARHGGRIWAEGVVGEGATFYFTLPQKVADR